MDKKINRDQCIKYSDAFTADEIQVHATTFRNLRCSKSWSAQAWKLLENVHMPKAVSNLCTACVQTWILLVHWSYCLAIPHTLELYTCLGTSTFMAGLAPGSSLTDNSKLFNSYITSTNERS